MRIAPALAVSYAALASTLVGVYVTVFAAPAPFPCAVRTTVVEVEAPAHLISLTAVEAGFHCGCQEPDRLRLRRAHPRWSSSNVEVVDPLHLEQPRKARVGCNPPSIVLHHPWLRPLAQTRVHRTWTPLKKQALLRARESPVDAEFVVPVRPTCGPAIDLSCAGAHGGSFTGAFCTAPVALLAENKKAGRQVGPGGPIVVVTYKLSKSYISMSSDNYLKTSVRPVRGSPGCGFTTSARPGAGVTDQNEKQLRFGGRLSSCSLNQFFSFFPRRTSEHTFFRFGPRRAVGS